MNRTVMIVDDSMVMRKMIEKILTKAGYTVVDSAKDTNEALSKFTEKKPDIVTLDIIMPGDLGLNIITKLLEINPKTCIVIVSGLHQKAIFSDAIRLGAKDYVVKPFEEDDLIKAVNNAVKDL